MNLVKFLLVVGFEILLIGLVFLALPHVLDYMTNHTSILSDPWNWWADIFRNQMPEYQEGFGSVLAGMTLVALGMFIAAGIIAAVKKIRSHR